MTRPEQTRDTSLQVDHLVLVASDVERTARFYADVLGAEVRDLKAWRDGRAEHPVLAFARWKINLHPVHTDLAPRASVPVPGSADWCFAWPGPIAQAGAHLAARGVTVELGPVAQHGARGPASSVYFRDPDGNLLELLSYQAGDGAS
jgi:catechol 2,3-dioxygenase-like lactoylglutathione lyase family enzyme